MQSTVEFSVSSLFLYPIKSCAGVRVDQLHFNAAGAVAGDRDWVVVNAASEVVWQGSHPRLALVSPEFRDDRLVLSAAAFGQIEVDRASADTRCDVKIWSEANGRHNVFPGYDAGDAAATFLSTVVAARVRLVRLAPAALARQGVSHAHVISLSSLAEVNAALTSCGQQAAEVERFRPNIVLTDHAEPLPPFIEEHVVDLNWGSGEQTGRLSVLAPCIRCVVPNVDPQTGLVAEEPLATVTRLSAQRHPGKPVYFGIYASAAGAAVLSAGATLVATLAF